MPKEEARSRTTRLSRLLDRVVQQRRRAGDRQESPKPDGPENQLAALEDRVGHLESVLEGLQDSVHRVASRQQREIEALMRKTEPAEMARALGRHSQRNAL